MTHTARWLLWLGFAAVLLVALVLVIMMFRRDLARGVTRQSVIHSQTMRTSFGDVEYLLQGEGPVVLISHGITGGVDQAQGLAAMYMGDGYRFIEVSRFGYLRSSMPKDPSPNKQADAFAELMNGLGIERAFVLGNSAGGTAALHFAIEHPDRCQGLILISSNVPGAAAARVYLFYRAERTKRWLCAVAKKLGGEGFLITAYVTDAVKIGESVWRS